MMLSEAQREFGLLWIDVEAEGDWQPVFDELVACYTGPGRHYHTLTHVRWGHRRIEEMRRALHATETSVNWNALRWAMWFHDAVLAGAPNDEALSARMAAGVAAEASLSLPFIGAVYRLIRATSHDGGELQVDEALFVDADISILGAPELDFDEYERQVRCEWFHVPLHVFARGRIAILKRFLDRQSVYSSEYGRGKWEERARMNLARSINRLEAF